MYIEPWIITAGTTFCLTSLFWIGLFSAALIWSYRASKRRGTERNTDTEFATNLGGINTRDVILGFVKAAQSAAKSETITYEGPREE